MEYLHHKSIPATKNELELFSVPATQTVIDYYYEVGYRPSASLESSSTFDFDIPASDDYTDLAETMIHIVGTIQKGNAALATTDDAHPCTGMANALFQQVEFYLNGVNISPSNNLYHYQAYLEDLLFRHPSEIDHGSLMIENEPTLKAIAKKEFDLFFRIHVPLSRQNSLLLSGIPMLIRLRRNPPYFGLVTASKDHAFKINEITMHIKRVKLYPDVQMALETSLEKSPARYFTTKNEVKTFVINTGLQSVNIENIFNGIMPKRMFVVFIKSNIMLGDGTKNPFYFDQMSIS
jgi:hypothetical protein